MKSESKEVTKVTRKPSYLKFKEKMESELSEGLTNKVTSNNMMNVSHVGAIDLLGFKNFISNSKNKDSSNENSANDFTEMFCFFNAIQHIIEMEIDLINKNLSETNFTDTKGSAVKVKYLLMSDSVYFFLPDFGLNAETENTMYILEILKVISDVMIYAYLNEKMYRGSFTKGEAVISSKVEDTIFYGEGIVKSYEIESVLSQYSRVIVDLDEKKVKNINDLTPDGDIIVKSKVDNFYILNPFYKCNSVKNYDVIDECNWNIPSCNHTSDKSGCKYIESIKSVLRSSHNTIAVDAKKKILEHVEGECQKMTCNELSLNKMKVLSKHQSFVNEWSGGKINE